jgi:hypothetical protein
MAWFSSVLYYVVPLVDWDCLIPGLSFTVTSLFTISLQFKIQVTNLAGWNHTCTSRHLCQQLDYVGNWQSTIYCSCEDSLGHT